MYSDDVDWDELRVQARCHELDWLCCLGSPSRVAEVIRRFGRMTEPELARLWKLICSCSIQLPSGPNGTAPPQGLPAGGPPGGTTPVPPTNGGAPPPTTDDTTHCQKLLNVACSPTGQLALQGAKAAVEKMGEAALDPELEAIVLAVAAAIAGIEKICQNKSTASTTLAVVCKGVAAFDKLPSMSTLQAIALLLALGPAFGVLFPMGLALRECCSLPTSPPSTLGPPPSVSQAPLPPLNINPGLILRSAPSSLGPRVGLARRLNNVMSGMSGGLPPLRRTGGER